MVGGSLGGGLGLVLAALVVSTSTLLRTYTSRPLAGDDGFTGESIGGFLTPSDIESCWMGLFCESFGGVVVPPWGSAISESQGSI